MTRKDYKLIAEALRRADSVIGYVRFTVPLTGEQYEILVSQVADALAADNPRFDRGKFKKACIQETAHD